MTRGTYLRLVSFQPLMTFHRVVVPSNAVETFDDIVPLVRTLNICPRNCERVGLCRTTLRGDVLTLVDCNIKVMPLKFRIGAQVGDTVLLWF